MEEEQLTYPNLKKYLNDENENYCIRCYHVNSIMTTKNFDHELKQEYPDDVYVYYPGEDINELVCAYVDSQPRDYRIELWQDSNTYIVNVYDTNSGAEIREIDVPYDDCENMSYDIYEPINMSKTKQLIIIYKKI